ncbi:MAG: aldo/keto reductase [Bacteroidia bacterium]
MLYRKLGKSGLQVSAFSFGSWLTFGKQVADGTAEAMLNLAYDSGINFFDNAETYAKGESEKVMGEILKKMDWDRSTYIVSSKVFWGGDKPNQKGLSFKHVVEACNAALQRLQVDYLDLYYCHRPDYNTPVSETVWAMNTLIQQGKILYWGTSEWPADRIMQAHMVAKQHNLIGPTMEQPQYNMLVRNRVEDEYRDLYEIGLGTTIWSPLLSGLLTGKYNDGTPSGTRFDIEGMGWLKERVLTESNIEKVRKLTAFANNEVGISMTHMALAWCLKNPQVSTVILGSSNVGQLESNLEALGEVDKLTPDVMTKIDEILGNKPNRDWF